MCKIIICHNLTDDLESLICPPVLRSADFINPFSQYQNSQCEEAVMNLTVFYARQLECN